MHVQTNKNTHQHIPIKFIVTQAELYGKQWSTKKGNANTVHLHYHDEPCSILVSGQFRYWRLKTDSSLPLSGLPVSTIWWEWIYSLCFRREEWLCANTGKGMEGRKENKIERVCCDTPQSLLLFWWPLYVSPGWHGSQSKALNSHWAIQGAQNRNHWDRWKLIVC